MVILIYLNTQYMDLVIIVLTALEVTKYQILSINCAFVLPLSLFINLFYALTIKSFIFNILHAKYCSISRK